MRRDLLLLTRSASELLRAGCSVPETFAALGTSDALSQPARHAALEVHASLLAGLPLSTALSVCRSVGFPKAYVGFVSASETSGDMARTFSFLRDDLARMAECAEHAVSVLAYPLVVVILSLVGSAVLIHYGESVFFLASAEGAVRGMILASVFLVVSCVLTALLVVRCVTPDERLRVCSAMSFLLGQHAGLPEALQSSLLVCRDSGAAQRAVMSALSMLHEGEPASSALGKLFPENCICIQLAEMTGDERGAFDRIRLVMEEAYKRKMKLGLSLLEPLVICAAGGYMIILLKTVVMPVLFTVLI